VGLNIATALRVKLRGTGCLPAGSGIGLDPGTGYIVYPDVAIYRDLPRPARPAPIW
jgi:hypothetical protein